MNFFFIANSTGGAAARGKKNKRVKRGCARGGVYLQTDTM